VLQFIDKVSWRLGRYMVAIRDEAAEEDTIRVPKRSFRRNYNVDQVALQQLFAEHDKVGSGAIGIAELESILVSIDILIECLLDCSHSVAD
jgi:hypothetical protein